MDLKAALQEERGAAYKRLRGGFPVPLAGTVYWLGLMVAGLYLPTEYWNLAAFFTSGLIFPMALLFAKIFNNNFIKDKTAITDLLLPAFVSMLLFWPMAVVAFFEAPQMVVLVLAVGLSIHWPVIGWTYGKTGVFMAHSISRAIAVTALYFALPDLRLIAIPAVVALVYLATTLFIYRDSGRK